MPDEYVKRSDVHRAFQPKYAPAINRVFATMIDSVPAADVVKVVRCRECIYNRGETKDLWGNPAIKCVTAVTHEPDWYCASGKRKDGGKNDV